MPLFAILQIQIDYSHYEKMATGNGIRFYCSIDKCLRVYTSPPGNCSNYSGSL